MRIRDENYKMYKIVFTLRHNWLFSQLASGMLTILDLLLLTLVKGSMMFLWSVSL